MSKPETRRVFIKTLDSGPHLACATTGTVLRRATLEEQYRSEQAMAKNQGYAAFEVPVKLTCLSMYRGHADAAKQRLLGLKVGGTQTEFWINDGLRETDMRIVAWGATPGDRKTAALAAFKAGGYYRGERCEARVEMKLYTDPWFEAGCAGSFIVGFAIVTALQCCARPPLPCSARLSDGSSACEPPIEASQLDGKWCDPTPGMLLCLEVFGPAARKSYVWSASDCFEYGQLSGGLEFSPTADQLTRAALPVCYAQVSSDVGFDLYSASADPGPNGGLVLYVDNARVPLTLVKVK